MSAATEVEIDYYVYVTATGKLEQKLSEDIVTYESAVERFRNNKQLFRTPVWVLGIDIDNT
jgi:hypothetical protein